MTVKISVRDFVCWLFFNVGAYLVLWLIHVAAFNVSSEGRPDWIGTGPDVWPIQLMPGICLFLAAINLIGFALELVGDDR